MATSGWTGRTITLKYKLDTYQGKSSLHITRPPLIGSTVFTRAKSCDRWISKKEDLFKVHDFRSSSQSMVLIIHQIGKELLLAELPLKIRLIGLRVTKLKDLRAETTTGIKRVRPLSIQTSLTS